MMELYSASYLFSATEWFDVAFYFVYIEQLKLHLFYTWKDQS